MAPTLKRREIAICVDGLGDNWLGGVNYFRNLVAAFDAAAVDDLRLHVLTDDAKFLDGMSLSPGVQVHVLPMLRRRSFAWALRKAQHVVSGRDGQLLAVLKRLQVEAVVFSYVAGARSGNVRCVPWIPDFQFKHHPEMYPAAVVEAEQRRAEKVLAQADGLLVSSEVARRDAVALLQAPADRVHVLRFAPRMDFGPLQSASLRDEVLARYGIDRPYLFLPNQYWQHKNHGLVVRALGLLRQSGRAMPLVVSTGKTQDMRKPAYFSDFAAEIQREGVESNYRVLGVIPRQDMMVLLAHSGGVLNPSRFEGWSTTVEEAKALGKALMLSDIAVHREQVAGRSDAQLYGTEEAAVLAEMLAAWDSQHSHGAVTAHPPRPDPSLYVTFEHQYITLLRQLAGAELRVA